MLVVAKKPKAEPTPFGVALRKARLGVGLTLLEVSHKTGIRESALSRLETSPDANPTWDTVCRLAAALGVSTATFEVHGEAAGDGE